MNRLAKIGDTIVQSTIYTLFALIPLILTPINYELFEYNKMMAVYLLTGSAVFGWILRSIGNRELVLRKTPLDLPIILFLASQFISALFSMDPHVSWFGYYSRFNGGMMSLLSYGILFVVMGSGFFDPRNEKPVQEKKVRSILITSLISAVLVSLYGVAQRLGIDKHIWVQDVQNRVFSTLGQPNWLAAFLVSLSPIAWYLAYSSLEKWNKSLRARIITILWSIVSVLFFLVLLFTRSRSGFLAFAVSDILFWGGLFFTRHIQKPSRMLPIVLHGVFAIIVFINGTHISQIDSYFTLSSWMNRIAPHSATQPQPTQQQTVQGPLLEVGGTESGTIRKYVWQAALDVWRLTAKNFLIGTGVETFAFAFYLTKPVAHNLTSEWDFLYNKAHNEYLNFLATTGLFGLATYVIFLGAYILWVLITILEDKKNPHTPLLLALATGWLSILITNFFGFSVVVVQLSLFLFPLLSFVLFAKQHEQQVFRNTPLHLSKIAQQGIILSSCIGIIIYCGALWNAWDADRIFTVAYRFEKLGQYAQAYPPMRDAVVKNPGEPLYRDERANLLTSISMTALDNGQTTLSAQLAQEAVGENERAIAISPNNVNFWKTRTKILYALASIDSGYLSSAIGALEHAAMLSPQDPKIYYNLGVLFAQSGDGQKAVENMEKAINLKINYRDAYKGLYVFFSETKQPEKAKSYLMKYLTTVDPSDVEFSQIMKGTQ